VLKCDTTSYAQLLLVACAEAKPLLPLLTCLPGRLGRDIAWVHAFILPFIPAFFPVHRHLAAFDVFVVSFRATLALLVLTIRQTQPQNPLACRNIMWGCRQSRMRRKESQRNETIPSERTCVATRTEHCLAGGLD